MPMMPVMRPPMRNVIFDGQRFEKSLAGLTTLAARFVASVARHNANNETASTSGCVNFVMSTTGSQIAEPKITTVAEVTATPMNEYNAIVVGNPMAWPMIWSC